MTAEMIARALCAVLVAVPGTLALVPDLDLTPGQDAVFLVLSLIGATILSQLPPAGKRVDPDALTARQTRQVADELERRMKRTPAKGGG